MAIKGITSCLWYDSQAEEAAKLYCSIFKNSKIGKVTHYGKEGFEVHGQPEGKVMTVDFELEGAKFVALNGGPSSSSARPSRSRSIARRRTRSTATGAGSPPAAARKANAAG